MVLDYLKSREKEVREVLKLKKKELSRIQINIKENQRFYQMLENSRAVPFTEFTPQVVSAGDRKKQQDLSQEEGKLHITEEELLKEIEDLQKELENISGSIDESVNLLTEARPKVKPEEGTEEKEVSEDKSEENNREKQEEDSDSIDKENIVSKLQKIQELVLPDPMRANLKLSELIKELNE